MWTNTNNDFLFRKLRRTELTHTQRQWGWLSLATTQTEQHVILFNINYSAMHTIPVSLSAASEEQTPISSDQQISRSVSMVFGAAPYNPQLPLTIVLAFMAMDCPDTNINNQNHLVIPLLFVLT